MKSVIHYNYHQLCIQKQLAIARYSLTIKVANVVTLKGSQTPCGLYAITVMTSVANSDDLVNVANIRSYKQQITRDKNTFEAMF